MAKNEAIFNIIDTNKGNKIVRSIKRSDDKKEKEECKNILKKNSQYEMYCSCQKPRYPSELKYAFRSDLAIYPLSNEKQEIHANSCPNSEVYKSNNKYNKGMEIENLEGKSITTFTVEGFPIRGPHIPKAEGEGRIGRASVEREQTGKLSVAAMIKNILMSEYEKYSRSKHDAYKEVNSLDGFMKFLWGILQSIYIKGYKNISLRDLTIEKDGLEFRCGVLNEFRDYKENRKEKVVTKYVLISSNGETKIGESDVMEAALKEFESSFHMKLEDCLSRKMKIFWAGFRRRYPGSNATYVFDLHFILLSNTGMFAESSYEVEMYDYINDFINKNHLKPKGVQFFKPFKFGYSVYQCMDCDRDFLEDGLIKTSGSDIEYVIEVFGMETDEYLERKRAKEGVFSEESNFKLIKWDVVKDKSIHVIDNMLETLKLSVISNCCES